MTMEASIAAERPETEGTANRAEKDEAAGGPVFAMKADPHFVAGRRDFLKYRDLGVTAASAGRIRAQLTSASAGLAEPTGWHTHICEGQFVYMLSGWVDLEFAGGRVVRIGEGDSVYIPGGAPHNEIATYETFELLEISVPADMGTETCPPP